MAQPSINQFLDSLGARLAVRRPSWDATDEATDTVVMKLWFHEEEAGTNGKSIRVWTNLPPGKKSDPIGRAERKRSIAHLEAGRPTYAVMRHGKDRHDPKAKLYDAEHLRKLNGVERRPNGDVYVKVEHLVTVEEFHARTGKPTLAQDIADIEARYPDKPTTRQALVQARLGQGRYRAELLGLWDNACAVTGCTIGSLLIASHARAWWDSNDRQRLDPHNGLSLIANLDRLFDQYLIAFDPDIGEMLVSDFLSKEDRALLGVPAPLRKKPTKKQAAYLHYHLEKFLAAQM
ncbi:HNH endonuclease signature motif containing protein [Ralstonia sp.]|uniref:HNH endonuclease n=1 Tax=Ralstonia sp. TaxID=54061 RepID=UPI002BB08ED3|nr:HNH endonuclease signature motif containing protein [Ralstonia sp.]HWV06699.1 HNH endonuclease signature motif containing protein [Ralstonia sp.]